MRLTTIFVAATVLFATFSMQQACALNKTALDEVSLSPMSTVGAFPPSYPRAGSSLTPKQPEIESVEDIPPTTVRVISNLFFAGLFVLAVKGQNRQSN